MSDEPTEIPCRRPWCRHPDCMAALRAEESQMQREAIVAITSADKAQLLDLIFEHSGLDYECGDPEIRDAILERYGQIK